MKKYALSVLLAAMLPIGAHAAPVDLKNKQYNLSGKMSVKGSARCNGFAGRASKVSPVLLTASIRFGESDQVDGIFEWFDDSTSAFDTTGEISERKGNTLSLAFDNDAATALLAMSSIPPNQGTGGTGMTTDSYSFKASATKKKLTVTEKVVLRVNYSPCTFRWTIKRKLSGPVFTPAPT